MSANAIEIRGLTKYYQGTCVVDQLHLDVRRGSILGFLGRNGAGKTTTIRMLMGLEEPTRGNATVLGVPIDGWDPELRARVGYLAEGHHLYPWMRVRECGKFQSEFFPKWNPMVFEAIIRHFGLRAEQFAAALSRGQRAGLCLALALAPEPELLVLDDPALGLDPVARRALLEVMVHVTRSEGRTILFSSHLLADVERVADRIAVMDRGILRAHCTVEEFRDRIRHYVLHFDSEPPPSPELPTVLHSLRTDRQLLISVVGTNGDVEAMLQALQPVRMECVERGLEDSFISYVGDRGEKTFLVNASGSKR